MRSIILFAAIPAFAADTTFSGGASQVLAKRCAACHRTGEIGPMPLTSYAEARPWAKAIKQAVVSRTMPPWHADAASSKHIANSRLLTVAEIQTIVDWADGGAKEGTPVKAARVEPTNTAWRLGEPDLIVRVPGYKVPAKGTVDYTFLITPTAFDQDKWIAAAEFRIDKRNVVHHMNAFIRPPGSIYLEGVPARQFHVATKTERGARKPGQSEPDRRELLIGYEPGYRPTPWGEGRAKLLRKGSDVVFEIHYTANGTEYTDNSELGIYFAKQPPRERVVTISPADSRLAIPPHDADYRSRATATFSGDAQLLAMQPHMHLRGKAFRIDATYPDGRKETLLSVPKYDFNWQTTYFLKSPLSLPAGTVLECEAAFDNSANNRFNPDPARTIQWGDQSWEEMNIGFMEIVVKADQNPDVVVLSDQPKPAPSSAALRD